MKQLESCQQEGSWTRLLFWLLMYLESTRKRPHFLLMSIASVPCVLSTAHCFSVSFPKSLGWVKYLIMHWHQKKNCDSLLNFWSKFCGRCTFSEKPEQYFGSSTLLWYHNISEFTLEVNAAKYPCWKIFCGIFFALQYGLFTVKTRKLCKVIWKKNSTFSPNISTRH